MPLESAPLLPIAVAFAAGIVGASWLSLPTLLLIALGGVLLLLAVGALGWRRDRAAAGLLVAGSLALGALQGASPVPPRDHIARQALPPLVAIEGRLIDEPVRWASDRTRLVLDVDGYQSGPDRRPASGRVQLTLYGEAVSDS